ncbi:MAG: DUF1330 domain-containing protein [Gemmatimonadales bacterium]
MASSSALACSSVLIDFPSLEQARASSDSPEYVRARQLRQGGAPSPHGSRRALNRRLERGGTRELTARHLTSRVDRPGRTRTDANLHRPGY